MKLQLQETRINVNKYTRLVQKMNAMFSVNVGNVTVLSQRKCVTVVSKKQMKGEIIFYGESVIAHTHTMWLSGLFLPRCSVILIIEKHTGHFIVKEVFIPT